MKGIVSKIRMNGYLEVKTDTITSVVELVGCALVNPGDEVEGDLDSLGGKILTNASSKEPFDAFVHEIN